MKQGVLSNIKENSFLKGFIKYVSLTLIFFVFCNAKIFGAISPCFYGVFLTILFLCKNTLGVCLSYVVGLFLNQINTQTIIFALMLCVAGSILKKLHQKHGQMLSTWVCCLYAFLFGLPYVFFNLGDISLTYISVVNVLLNAIFTLCSFNFFKIIKTRKFNLNLNTDEIFCACLLLSFLFCGLQNLNVFSFDIVKFFGVLLALICCAVLKNSFSVIIAIVAGFGAGLPAGELNYITLFSLISIFACMFKGYSKSYTMISCLLIDFVFGLFFINTYSFNVSNIFPTIFACLIYLFLPKKLLENLQENLYLKSENNSLKNILNQNKLQVSKRLLYTAEIFHEMNKNFRKLVKGSVDINSAKKMIRDETIKHNCEGCANKNKCFVGRENEIKNIYEFLIKTGFEKGKISLVDLPAYLTNRCIKLNQVVGCINALLEEYKEYKSSTENLDNSKILIADQLGGISHILNDLSQETRQIAVIDYKTEQLIKENLIYNNIVPSEVVCFEKDEKTNVVSLIIRTIDFDNNKIENVLNKTLKSKMVLDDVFPQINKNLTYLNYKTAPTYNIAVGIAQTSKGGEKICGDTHAVSKLSNDKFMFALCDGMGHGERANKASELSINLIENFYKAGYDNHTILSSVNKLLNLGKEDVFSALDVSVVDLKSGQIDFIKQGATIGFIKNGGDVTKIKSSSLPLGILDEVKPNITKTVLNTSDIVIMLSDGISDAFVTEEELENFLKSLKEINPQIIADKILTKAKTKQKNYPKDDMTVLVGKLFYNFN